jgi:hypothetical protein
VAVGADGRDPGDGLVVVLWRSTHAQGKGSSDAAVAGIGLRDTLPGQMSDDYTGGVGVLVHREVVAAPREPLPVPSRMDAASLPALRNGLIADLDSLQCRTLLPTVHAKRVRRKP